MAVSPLLPTTTMRTTTIVGLLLASGLAAGLDAQSETAAELSARKERKLAESWLKNADWTRSFADAKARAEREGLLILGYFTRSYAP